VEQAVLLTVHYRDLFQHALTVQQVHTYLIGRPATVQEVNEAIRRLTGDYLSVVDGHVTWMGREHLVRERRRREAISRTMWPWAHRCGRWIRALPFVRMVGVTGSLSVNHAGCRHDIDLLCVTAPGRVWLVVAWLWLLQEWSKSFAPFNVGANCVFDETHLSMPAQQQNLYLAHQVAHLVPLWGAPAYGQLLEANRWIAGFLPNFGAPPTAQSVEPGRSRLRAVAEQLVPAGLAQVCSDRLYCAGWKRALGFYSKIHSADVLAEARNPRRYMVPGLGYGPTVYRRFLEGHGRLSSVIGLPEMQAAFGGNPEMLSRSDRRLDGLMFRKYGALNSGPGEVP
jgi:hypothetical protein